jgi:hypothetical protein
VVGFCECSDEPFGSGTTELVSYVAVMEVMINAKKQEVMIKAKKQKSVKNLKQKD